MTPNGVSLGGTNEGGICMKKSILALLVAAFAFAAAGTGGASACVSPPTRSEPSPETTKSTSCRSPSRRGRDRPGAKRITRCTRRSQPVDESIVVRTAAVSPSARRSSTAVSETT